MPYCVRPGKPVGANLWPQTTWRYRTQRSRAQSRQLSNFGLIPSAQIQASLLQWPFVTQLWALAFSGVTWIHFFAKYWRDVLSAFFYENVLYKFTVYFLPQCWKLTSVCRHELGGGFNLPTPDNSNPVLPYLLTYLVANECLLLIFRVIVFEKIQNYMIRVQQTKHTDDLPQHNRAVQSIARFYRGLFAESGTNTQYTLHTNFLFTEKSI